MKMLPCAPGLLALCLTTLCACTQAPPSMAPAITLHECAAVTPCTMPAMKPRTNGELSDALTVARAAWARCASEVDMIATCQARVRLTDGHE
ncbi:Rz1-like lysis system protein LysC [Burkholderia pseudomallei]|uniref:Rz1-like lysis system protein LysC n=1 Tax=pseudomallei group TaxID=111527 RepID=UPI001CA511F4|nr:MULTISPECIES: Rz1-like lysis system protein LysC [pseudomallei group]MEB5483257.1 Rz1-like lysis system protein LysC [Burkholderia pseudomallei]MEB5490188.1 Rz1-like lysis system protein LysC [Burkholderia pseudomallei]MEB5496507.1 Rz1-like lysis system protein LysC [Burkholderia pseudomallei]MEB5502059.1 Rz1-like lysis system protein LysC [Burkholderia pseudomallei]MEB5509303.1 Rz1-like lysis system protein LysC [Burkholderia pseudomallei]